MENQNKSILHRFAKSTLMSSLENIIVITQKTAITNLLLKVGLSKMSIMLIIIFL